jgi:phosphate butyryltransferase
MAKDFEELLILAQEKGPKRISVAVAEDKGVLSAIKIAKDRGIIEPVLVGNKEKIDSIAKEVGLNLDDVKIIHEEDGIKASRIATELVTKKEADVLMKGLIDTSIIMKQVLDREIGLRNENVISHIALFEVPTYHKIFMVTDAAMNIAPDLVQKKEIIENAVNMALSIGISMPKVAVLAAKEKVSPKMEATIDAGELKSMNEDGIIKNCIVDGPLALDNAINEESAKIKGIESEVAGDADILIVPDIEAGNVLYKALTFLANARSAGLIVGARAPIVLTSRADNEEAKLNSIALATLMASMGGDHV